VEEGATAVAQGNAMGCAARGNDVVCWDYAKRPIDWASPVRGHATRLAAGSDFACAVPDAGGVACWGGNDNGQLADGTFGRVDVPVAASGLRDAIDVVASDGHSCALIRGGKVACWGNDTQKQVDGAADVRERLTPVTAPAPPDTAGLALGSTFTCALRRGGALSCWGQAPIAAIDGISQASAAGGILCAVLASGNVRCLAAGAPAWDPGVSDATRVQVGGYQACALQRGGRVMCFGFRPTGNEVVLDMPQRVRPEPTEAPGVVDPIDFAVGDYPLVAVMRDGRVLTWKGAIEGTAPEPAAPVEGIADAVQVSAGRAPCVVRRTGEVVCWSMYELPAHPQAVPGIHDATRVSAGAYHACAVTRRGNVLCWGSDAIGRLGDGRTDYRREPGLVLGLPVEGPRSP
jgi:hypothetical protein